MNKIYKVIYSKVRHCYVVVSEIARNQGKAHSSHTSLAEGTCVLALTLGLLLGAPGTVQADSVNLDHGASAYYDDKGNLTIGKNVQAEGKNNTGSNNTVIGTDTDTTRDDGTGNGQALDDVSNTKLVEGEGKAHELNRSTESSGDPDKGSTAVGYDSHAEGDASTAIGNKAVVKNAPTTYYADADGNKTTSQTDAVWYKDSNGKPTKVPQVFRDADNKTTTTPQYIHTYTEKDATTGQTVTKTEITTDATKADKNSDGSLKYSYQKEDNTKHLYSVTLYQPSSNSIAVGSEVEADGENAVAVGYQSTAKSSAVAIGDNANAEKDSVAIGKQATASVEGGVALGMGSTANRAGGVAGWDPKTGTASTDTSSVWKSGNGAISVGNENGSRQITNVAAGSEDSDAVNVAQLKKSMIHYYSVKTTEETDQAGNNNYLNDGATGNNALAAGVNAKATADNATAVGMNTQANGENSSAYGYKATAAQKDSVAIGSGATAQSEKAISIGAHAIGTNSIAIGSYKLLNGDTNPATSAGENSIAIGGHTNSNNNVAVGAGSYTSGGNAVTVGGGATGDYATSLGGGSVAGANKASAVGYSATSSGEEATALGANAHAGRNQSVAIGSSTANGNQAVAIGSGAAAGSDNYYGSDSGMTAVGQSSIAHGQGATALGYSSHAGGTSTTAIGSSNAYGSNTIAIGGASTSGSYTVAIGSGATATDSLSIALGNGSHVSGTGSTGLGSGSNASNSGTAVGYGVQAGGYQATAIGVASNATGANATAIGGGGAWAANSVAIGSGAGTNTNAVSIGKDSNAWGENGVSLGTGSSATGLNSTAIGGGKAYSDNGVAIGSNAQTNKAITIGKNSSAWGDSAIAIGEGADAWRTNSIVIGRNSKSGADKNIQGFDPFTGKASTDSSATWNSTDEAVSFGRAEERDEKGNVTKAAITRQLNNVAAGTIDTDAVNVAQLKQVKQAIDTVENHHSTVEAGTSGNVTVTEGTNAASGKKYTVDLNNNVNFGKEDKQISINGDNGTVTIGQGDKQIKLDSKDGSITAGGVTINNGGKGTVNGLTNKTWDGEHITSGQAATEDQLQKVEQNVNQKISNVDQKVDKVAKQHTTVSVNGGQAAGNLIMEKTLETDEKGANYDISLSNDVTIGTKGENGQDGKLTVISQDGSKAITADGKEGTLTLKDGNNETSIKAAEATKGVDGITDIKRVAVDGHTVATLDDGMKFAGDSGEALKQKLNSTTNIKGGATGELSDGNIGVVSDGNDTLTVKLAKDIKGLDSVEANTVNATTVNTTRFNVAGDSTHNAITIKQGDVNMGGNTISGVAPGKVSPDSTEAVNGSQLYARDQAIGKLGNTVNHLDNKINRAGAGAAALAALHPQDFDPDDKWDFAAGYGNYHGASAAAIGAFYRPTEDVMVSVGGSMGGGENMVNAGVTFKLGQHNHVSNSRVAMAKEIRDLKATVGQLTQMVNQLTGNGGGRTLPLRKGDTLFPDVPKNHWAYDYVTKLAQAGLLEGYPDGEFKGNRMMTRYEFAALVYRAIMGGAAANPKLNQGGTLDRLVDEFGDELQYIRIVVIDRDKDGKPTIERVRTVEDDRKHHHGKEREQQPLEQGL
ncbi:ESPR-type extended signal peptide-containing protein [Acidaminococcus timonensis]|uniref:ESPR-type extended signal peptide-containing protein n=1 Tax=Acidaminococcus timonensis TaxID=1871002 RepID=UPI00307C02AE